MAKSKIEVVLNNLPVICQNDLRILTNGSGGKIKHDEQGNRLSCSEGTLVVDYGTVLVLMRNYLRFVLMDKIVLDSPLAEMCYGEIVLGPGKEKSIAGHIANVLRFFSLHALVPFREFSEKSFLEAALFLEKTILDVVREAGDNESIREAERNISELGAPLLA